MYKLNNEKLDYSKYYPIGIVKSNFIEDNEELLTYLEIIKSSTKEDKILDYQIKFIYLKDHEYYDSLILNVRKLIIDVTFKKENEFIIDLNGEKVKLNKKQFELLVKIK